MSGLERTMEDSIDKFLGRYNNAIVSSGEFSEDDKNIVRDIQELCSIYLLTVSASDYINLKKRHTSTYGLKSVETMNKEYNTYGARILSAKMEMAFKARKLEAEVVLDIKPSITFDSTSGRSVIYLIGTALIPEEKDRGQINEVDELFKKIGDQLSKENTTPKPASTPL